LALLIGLGPGLVQAGNTLKDVSFSVLPGNKVQFRLTLTGPAVAPKTFSTDAPARLVLDFPNTALALPHRTLRVGVGAAHSLTAVQAGNRTRVVVNLDRMAPYELRTAGNAVVLTLDSGLALATQETRSDPQTPSLARRGLRAIDFRRGPGGEGRVLVTLDSPDIQLDLKEEGRNVVLDVLNARLPPALHQKLDVVDFATPVQSIVSEAKGDNVRIRIQAKGEYEYLAYQVDRLYTLEFRAVTPEEQERIKKQRLTYKGEKLTLNFQDIPVRTVLHLLGDFNNRNMVISDTVQGNVTLRLNNVPWDQALDIILKTKLLDKREQNNVIYVAPAAELMQQEQTTLEAAQKIEELAPLHLEMIRINYADADEIAAVLKSAGSASSTRTDDRSKFNNGGPGQPDQRSLNSTVKAMSYTEGQSLLSPRGHITVHKQTNSLLIQDTAQKLEEIRAIIAKLDIPVRQVLIESRIVIASNDFAKELGVRFGWSGSREIADGNVANMGGGMPGYLNGTELTNKGPWLSDVSTGQPFNSGIALGAGEALLVNLPSTALLDGGGAAANFLVGKIGSYLLQLELSAMQSEGRGEIISSPRVSTANGETALIKQGSQLAYTTTDAQGTTTIFKDAVLSLEVTPRITADSRINMKLEVHRDNPNAIDRGAIDTRSVKTTVLVDNGETVVLGGVYERTKSDHKNSVPFFGDIPLLGHLFQRTSKSDSNTELLIFVTPKILKETSTLR